jgi:hypothetical protein
MGVPVCRSVSTILAIWSVFHTKMALDTKAQAARFVHDLLVIPGAEFSLVGEKDPACQTVPVLYDSP